MRRIIALCLLLAPACSMATVLVRDGRPAATIVLAPTAPDSVRYAAEELQRYLEQVSGARLPIRTSAASGACLYVGESAATRKLGLSVRGLKPDGFRVASGPNWVAVVGRDYAGPPISGIRNPWRAVEVVNDKLKLGAFGEAGTLYGAYRLLEEVCGIRWYMPGDLGTVIPKRRTINTGKISLSVSPDFEYRYPWFCNFAESEADARWFRRAGFGAPAPAQCIDSFAMFLKHKEAHPEYFALIGGQRDFTNLSCITGGGNLCLSNPGLVRQCVADIRDYFRANPSQSTFPLSPNDGMTKVCECPDCRKQVDPGQGEAGRFSNVVWSFIDKVARGVAKACPGKFVGAIAYERYNTPPTRIARLSPNIAVMICQSRSSFVDPKRRAEARRAIDGWRTRATRVYLWEYYLFSWPPMRGFPVFFPHLLARDLASLKGVSRGEFIEAESGVGGTSGMDCPGMAHVNLYLTARLMWRADQSVDALLEEYYSAFYGPARKPMKAFWTAAEEAWTARGASGNPINIYTRSDLARLASCLDQAVAATPEGSDYRKRVELIRDEFAPARRKLSNALVVNPPKLSLKGPGPAVRIDGLLDDEAWSDAEPFSFVTNDGEAAPHKSWGYAAWDPEGLVLAFSNYDPEMGKLTARATRRDQDYAPGMWDDDSVEIFLSPDPAKRASYRQFIINADGLIWDARTRDGAPGMDLAWNSSAVAVTRREPNRWVLEVRIPFRDLGLSGPVAGKALAANFYRNRYCGGPAVYSCWSPTLTIQHANPERFGMIEFGTR